MEAASYGLVVLFTLVVATVSQTNPICPDIFPPPNSLFTAGWYNSYYIVRCNPGYVIQGNSIVRCIDGQWSSLPPKCQQIPDADVCPDLETPEHGHKDCNEGPHFPGTYCRFKCFDGYKLMGASVRLCMNELRWSFLQPKCIPETDSFCTVPRPLTNGRVIGCSPRKVPTVGKSCHFSCNNGYVLQGPSSLHCQPNGKLTDLDGNESYPECVSLVSGLSLSHEHQNHPSPSHRFENPEEFRGSHHQVSQSEEPVYSTTTSPRPVYRPAATIRPRHEPRRNYPSCNNGNGGCEHHCEQRRGQIECRCRNGYTLAADRKSCVDIDECAHETRNQCQQTCHNRLGGYTCSCIHGYRKVGDYKCKGCRKDSYWLDEENGCVECPDNSYTDSEAKLSIEDCQCQPGFIGSPKENIPCQDVDECAANNYNCSDNCVNTPGSVYCSCPIGFTLDTDNKTCIDIDECSIKNGGCQGLCHNTEGSFYCSCQEGYTTSNKDQYSCDDVDECLENNGGCAQKCNNYPGGHYCSCYDGYRLHSGLQNCTDIRCPSLLTPHYSTMTCRLEKSVLLTLESYPVGSRCDFNCVKGFKLTASSNRVKCKEDGTWVGVVPQCKSQHCPALDVPENADIHPRFCSKKGISVKQRCTFTCHPGYQLKGKSVFTCLNNLTWSIKEIPECQPEKIQPTIECPEDISVDLLFGKDAHNITINAPITNVEGLKIRPDWVSIESPIQFPAGTTNVIFTASVPNTKRFARCTTTVNVIDKEAPLFNFCPESIEIDGVGAEGVQVTWDEPLVSDNVKVESIESTLKSNSTLRPGSYNVKYIAKDSAGNVASCSFDIILNRTHCNDLADPINGFANCMHWMFGKICSPSCDDGYARHPNDAEFYSCDDAGEWEPANVISNCLKYIPPVLSTCPESYEMIENRDTGEEICVECRANTVWSASTRTCEDLETMQAYNTS